VRHATFGDGEIIEVSDDAGRVKYVVTFPGVGTKTCSPNSWSCDERPSHAVQIRSRALRSPRARLKQTPFSPALCYLAGDYRPLEPERFIPADAASDPKLSALGAAAIARGELAVVLLNGGMATRFWRRRQGRGQRGRYAQLLGAAPTSSGARWRRTSLAS